MVEFVWCVKVQISLPSYTFYFLSLFDRRATINKSGTRQWHYIISFSNAFCVFFHDTTFILFASVQVSKIILIKDLWKPICSILLYTVFKDVCWCITISNSWTVTVAVIRRLFRSSRTCKHSKIKSLPNAFDSIYLLFHGKKNHLRINQQCVFFQMRFIWNMLTRHFIDH